MDVFFCLNSEAWSCRCLCMGSVKVLNAAFCMTCS